MNRFLLKLLIILVIVFLAWATFVPREPFSEETVLFKIEKGEGSRDIAFNLEKEGFIIASPVFRLYVLTLGIAENLQAGVYSLSPSMSVPKIAGILSRGETAKDKITIIEGWTLRDIASYFKEKGISSQEELFALTGLPLSSDSKEGFLFPDTYLVDYGASLDEIISQIESNFDSKLDPYLEAIQEKGLSLEEIITMASLIEKEVQTKEDKEMVSGIFWKRVKAGVPLQSCASIAYIKGVPQWRYSFEDTRIESPYNTYLYYGLPPGPISNPGLDSIEAAIYPKDSLYWYYLSTLEGETIYSRTLDEHNAATAKYLR